MLIGALGIPAGLASLGYVAHDVLGYRLAPVMIPDAEIEYVLKPSQDVTRYGHTIQVNRYSMRSGDFDARVRAPGELRVMVFGDSVVSGVGFTDQRRLATTLLRTRLERQIGRPIVVGNVAAGSWGPRNWLAYARRHGFLGADVVVLVASAHDYVDTPDFRPMHPAPRAIPAPFAPIVEFAAIQRARIVGAFPQASAPSTPEVLRAEEALADLAAFLELARAKVPVVIVMLHPEIGEVTGPTLAGSGRIAQVCAAVGVPLHDLAVVYRGAATHVGSLYHDTIHPTDAGQEALARAIQAAIPLQLLD